ncbi:MAG: Bug family tripartite tricarboxylate transporter substrate binding protein [Lautropia sp.]
MTTWVPGWIKLGTMLATVACITLAEAQPAPKPSSASGDAYPTRAIRMIVAFPPGGPTDIVSRIIAKRLSEQLGQPIIIDNKPGAGGNIGAETAARAAPDGYTLFYNTSAITIAPAVYARVNFDPVKDFAPVSTTAAVPMVVMVNPALPVKTIGELVAYVKANPGRLNYGSTGTGTITHLASAAFAASAGLDIQHVPYKGSAPNIADLAAGTTQMTTDTLNSSIAFIKDGRVRPLAVTTKRRTPIAPELPTLDETVLPGMEMSAWQGIVAPAGTPSAIVVRLNEEIGRALSHPEVVRQLAAQGTDILGSTPKAYSDMIRSELARWVEVARSSKARVQ